MDKNNDYQDTDDNNDNKYDDILMIMILQSWW